MNKDILLDKLTELFDLTHGFGRTDFENVLDKFFSQNVVIPKGENRHPYADIIHQKLEDMSLKLEVKQDKARYAGWVKHIGLEFMKDEYRIKPSEPVYEYLWMELRTPDTYDIARNRYMTEKEAVEYFNDSITYFAVKETKRERK